MYTFILSLHLILCVLIILFVLLQSGKEDMGIIFGGGSNSVFGSSGAGNLLAKITAFLAIIFVVTSLSYTILTSTNTSSKSKILDVQLEDTPNKVDNTEPTQ